MASLWSSRARRRARPAALQSPRRNGALHPRFDSHLLRDMISTSNFWFSQVVVHSQLHLRMCSGGPEGARGKSLRQSKMVRPAALPQWSTTFVVPVIRTSSFFFLLSSSSSHPRGHRIDDYEDKLVQIRLCSSSQACSFRIFRR